MSRPRRERRLIEPAPVPADVAAQAAQVEVPTGLDPWRAAEAVLANWEGDRGALPPLRAAFDSEHPAHAKRSGFYGAFERAVLFHRLHLLDESDAAAARARSRAAQTASAERRLLAAARHDAERTEPVEKTAPAPSRRRTPRPTSARIGLPRS